MVVPNRFSMSLFLKLNLTMDLFRYFHFKRVLALLHLYVDDINIWGRPLELRKMLTEYKKSVLNRTALLVCIIIVTYVGLTISHATQALTLLILGIEAVIGLVVLPLLGLTDDIIYSDLMKAEGIVASLYPGVPFKTLTTAMFSEAALRQQGLVLATKYCHIQQELAVFDGPRCFLKTFEEQLQECALLVENYGDAMKAIGFTINVRTLVRETKDRLYPQTKE